jgi:hypothetical protein
MFGNVITKVNLTLKTKVWKDIFLFNNDRLEVFGRIEYLCSSNKVNTFAILSVVSTEAETINKRKNYWRLPLWLTMKKTPSNFGEQFRGLIGHANPSLVTSVSVKLSQHINQGQLSHFKGHFGTSLFFRGYSVGNEQSLQNGYGRGVTGKGISNDACYACNLNIGLRYLNCRI